MCSERERLIFPILVLSRLAFQKRNRSPSSSMETGSSVTYKGSIDGLDCSLRIMPGEGHLLCPSYKQWAERRGLGPRFCHVLFVSCWSLSSYEERDWCFPVMNLKNPQTKMWDPSQKLTSGQASFPCAAPECDGGTSTTDSIPVSFSNKHFFSRFDVCTAKSAALVCTSWNKGSLRHRWRE